MNFNDQAALAFVTGEAYRINQRVYESRHPDWDFARLIWVDDTGPEWSPGVITYTTDSTGRADWQAGGAKDIPLADVSQDRSLRSHSLAAIGYGYNIEEINSAIQVGGSLPDRRARAARLAYMQFMYNVTIKGDATKGLTGLINYTGVNVANAPADGTGSATQWVDASGVGLKNPAQIVRDINLGLRGVQTSTFETVMADTVLLPVEAFNYIASTPYSAVTMETILSFVMRTNIYTLTTGRPLTIRANPELSKANAAGTGGRMVVYKNSEEFVKLHLPMAHRFLPVYQSGPLQFEVPGIFRTGGVELLTDKAMRYIDGISLPPA